MDPRNVSIHMAILFLNHPTSHMSDLSQLSDQDIRRQLFCTSSITNNSCRLIMNQTSAFSAYITHVDEGKAWVPVQLASYVIVALHTSESNIQIK